MTRQRAGLPFAGCLLLALLLAACAAPATPGVTNTPDATAIPPTATAVPPTPTTTPEPDLTQADLWAAGFTTVVNRADAFVIRKGDVTLDLSLLATGGDPQIPPALNPLRLHATLLEQFEVLAPVRLRAQATLAAGQYPYTIEEGALLETRSAMSYTVGTLLFPVDGALLPTPLASADAVVRRSADGASVEQLTLTGSETGGVAWTLVAVAQAPAWTWAAPATPTTYPLTAEDLEWYVETALNQDLAAHGSPLRLSLGEQTGATVTLLATRLAAPGETDIDPKPLGALDPTEHTLTHPAFGTAVVTQLEVTGDGLILLPANQSGEAAPAVGEQATEGSAYVFDPGIMKWTPVGSSPEATLTPEATSAPEAASFFETAPFTMEEIEKLLGLDNYTEVFTGRTPIGTTLTIYVGGMQEHVPPQHQLSGVDYIDPETGQPNNDFLAALIQQIAYELQVQANTIDRNGRAAPSTAPEPGQERLTVVNLAALRPDSQVVVDAKGNLTPELETVVLPVNDPSIKHYINIRYFVAPGDHQAGGSLRLPDGTRVNLHMHSGATGQVSYTGTFLAEMASGDRALITVKGCTFLDSYNDPVLFRAALTYPVAAIQLSSLPAAYIGSHYGVAGKSAPITTADIEKIRPSPANEKLLLGTITPNLRSRP